jgi:hypothetical protein
VAKRFIVITTINPMNQVLAAYAALPDWKLVVVGDRKGPRSIDDPRVTFLGIDGQGGLGFDFVKTCPENNYARKNIGYLYALSQGAEIVAETDDDNAPLAGWGEGIGFSLPEAETIRDTRYYNVYRDFTDRPVWPRGYPLDAVSEDSGASRARAAADVGVWQFLADQHPDVDAIYRLTRGDPVFFARRPPLVLAPHVYCPFNSQNTFWRRETCPYLFLPVTVTMRFTDILRGYVAQRLLWDNGMTLAFGSATVIQDRNVHNLMRDFQDEVPMYQQTRQTVDILENLPGSRTPLEGLLTAYAALGKASIVTPREQAAVEAWTADLRRMGFA